MYKITSKQEDGSVIIIEKTGSDMFGVPVMCTERERVVVGYEKGVVQTFQHSQFLIASTVFGALAKHCHSYHFSLGDYTELYNLLVWCWVHHVPSDEVCDLLGEWEGTHGPHVDYDWYQELVKELAWQW